jgi:uncharacterized membrane protein YwaF
MLQTRAISWLDRSSYFFMRGNVPVAPFLVLLDPAVLAPDVGWRLAFLIGAVLGLVIFLMRLWLPESPRWLDVVDPVSSPIGA